MMKNYLKGTICTLGNKSAVTLVLLWFFLSVNVYANNISISNTSLTGQNTTGKYVTVQFTASWDNSWRMSAGAANWDAAWVFVKYRVKGNYVSAVGASSSGTTITVTSTNGLRVGMPVRVTAGTGAFVAGTVVTVVTNSTTFTVSTAPATPLSGGATRVTGYPIWEHAGLNSTGHTAPSGSTLDIGLLTPGSAFDATTNPGIGAFLYRSAAGSGSNTFSNAQLRWNYGSNGVGDNDVVDIQVNAIEMVYVPANSFTIGSGGTESGSFTDGSWSSGATVGFTISSENALTIGQSAGSLWGTSASGNNTIGTAGTLAAPFPKGYAAFYCMKYEISQQQYVDFLNTLTRAQQATRTSTSLPIGTTSVSNRYVMSNSSTLSYRNGIRCDAILPENNPVTFYCDFNGSGSGGDSNDGLWIACNWLSWSDLAAYLNWSGLRPVTELEFEKACRGTISAVPNENAWGTADLAINAYTLTNSGEVTEVIATNYNTLFGNSLYSTTGSTINGPVRVGIFAGTTGNTGRTTSGATYYGIMEMTGNLWERTITVANATGKAFTGAHGNGTLDSTGNAQIALWPGTDAVGTGLRGGGCDYGATALPVSSREYAANTISSRAYGYGGRGERLAP